MTADVRNGDEAQAFTPDSDSWADIPGRQLRTSTGLVHGSEFAYLFGHTLQRDHQYELRPIDIPAMADGSPQLF